MQTEYSFLANLSRAICWLFAAFVMLAIVSVVAKVVEVTFFPDEEIEGTIAFPMHYSPYFDESHFIVI